MIRTLKKFETNLAEITYMIQCGWEVFEEEVDGVWLYKEIQMATIITERSEEHTSEFQSH